MKRKGKLFLASIAVTVLSAVTCFTPVYAAVDSNYGDNGYGYYWSDPVKSYMYQNADQTLTTVQAESNGIYHQEYKADGRVISQGKIEIELTSFGGFYHGSTANYIVVGQSNQSEDNTKEVIRIIKYSFDWKRLGSCSLYGEDTYVPFEAGSLRFAESGDNLVVRTCHTMYASASDPKKLHHQSNLTFYVNTASMTAKVLSYAGYASHSFNQFIQYDGTKLVAVDHGDAYPRAIMVTQFNGDFASKTSTPVKNLEVIEYPGTIGLNATGATVGGLEISDSSYLIVGTNANHASEITYTDKHSKNLFICTIDKTAFDKQSTTVKYLTDYSDDSQMMVTNPQLVKINDGSFMILWQEYSSAGKTKSSMEPVIKYVMLDGKGNPVSSTNETSGYLSDCQPIMLNGAVTWFYTKNTEPMFCQINISGSASTAAAMYRMYNPNSGEHFYTANAGERDHLLYVGWKYEGIGWAAPVTSSTPVYRLYNANGGEHHYTVNSAEKDMLVSAGWNYEGIGWYSDDAKEVPLYRQYNPNAFSCNHNYTTNQGENDWLVSLGWYAEGIGWYGIN